MPSCYLSCPLISRLRARCLLLWLLAGAVFAQVLQYSGFYLAAGVTAIAVELGLMAILLTATLLRLTRQRALPEDSVEIDETLIVAPD